jgi:hypothetical protein
VSQRCSFVSSQPAGQGFPILIDHRDARHGVFRYAARNGSSTRSGRADGPYPRVEAARQAAEFDRLQRGHPVTLHDGHSSEVVGQHREATPMTRAR